MDKNELDMRLAERPVGQIPVSIATSLALEGAFGIHPDGANDNKSQIGKYTQVWVNIRTLARNLINCLPKDLYDNFHPEYAIECLQQEMQHIEGAVISASNGSCSVVFYSPDYTKAGRELPGGKVKAPGTPKQMFADSLERIITHLVVENVTGVDIRQTPFRPAAPTQDVLMLTHMPTDLLGRYNFRKLDLLESHTGVVKGPALWYSKLTNGRELPPLPFNDFTVKVFGDNNNLFSMQSIKLRREILQLAERDRWTAITTREKILAGIKSIEDKVLRAEAQTLI